MKFISLNSDDKEIDRNIILLTVVKSPDLWLPCFLEWVPSLETWLVLQKKNTHTHRRIKKCPIYSTRFHSSTTRVYWSYWNSSRVIARSLSHDQSGPARGGSGIPIYPLFCPQDTNIPQNRKMCDTKYLKLFWNRILNTWKWTEFKSVDGPARLLQFANRLVL